jgi:hypothetical protein
VGISSQRRHDVGMEGITGFDADEDFYEDDEPVEDIMTAFSRGERFVTARPVTVELVGPTHLTPSSWRWPVRISVRATPAALIIPARA